MNMNTQFSKNLMTKTNRRKFDAFDAVAQLNLSILKQKPTISQMKRDIQMNRLRIKPHMGDVFSLNMSNDQFIEALWSIIKIDEYIENTVDKLPRKEVDMFYQMSSYFRQQFQDTLNRIDMRLPHMKSRPTEQPVAIEIFRDMRKSKQRVH
jgi:hypothetical protein